MIYCIQSCAEGLNPCFWAQLAYLRKYINCNRNILTEMGKYKTTPHSYPSQLKYSPVPAGSILVFFGKFTRLGGLPILQKNMFRIFWQLVLFLVNLQDLVKFGNVPPPLALITLTTTYLWLYHNLKLNNMSKCVNMATEMENMLKIFYIPALDNFEFIRYNFKQQSVK